MNAEQQGIFRGAVLRTVDANRTRFGLGTTAIRLNLRQYGFADVTEDQVLDALDYLQLKGLVEEVHKKLNASERAWRITAEGIGAVDSGEI